MEHPENIVTSVERLESLLKEQSDLAARLETANPRLKPAYETSLGNLALELEKLVNNEEVKDYFHQEEARLFAETEEISGLFSRGLLTQEQWQEQVEGLMKHEDYRL